MEKRRLSGRGNSSGNERILQKAAIFSTLGLMLVFGAIGNHILPVAYAATSILTVNGLALDGKPVNMWIAVQSNGETIATGFTPLKFDGNTGSTYAVIARDYLGGSVFFSHWENESADRTRMVTLDVDTAITAYYITPNSQPSSYVLTVNAVDQNEKARSMYTTVRNEAAIVKTGFTTLTHEDKPGATLSVTVSDYGSISFDRWEDGSTARTRIISLSSDVTVTAFYKDNTLFPNNSPVAAGDSAATNQDESVVVNVLVNDSDPDGDSLTVTSLAGPAHGSAKINGDNTVTYAPARGFSGTDSFNYTISDGKGASATALVTVTVKALTPPSTSVLEVNAVDMSGNAKPGMYTVIRQGSTTVKTGFTPMSFTGVSGVSYSVAVSDYTSSIFDHWENGSTTRTRTVTLSADTTVSAYFRVPLLASSPASGPIDTSVTVTGNNFSPNSSVSVTYDGKAVASATTNSAGSFAASFKVPKSEVGFHTVLATDAKGWNASTRFEDTTVVAAHLLDDSLPNTGVIVALYMYPGTTGSVHWQKVIDEKTKHPSVPIVAIFNPSSGPGTSKNSVIAGWVDKLQDSGVIAIGYVPDGYADTRNPGTRTMTYMKDAFKKYNDWYGADGIFLDEFPNKVGYESRYSDLTAYAKSLGMKMTVANPGTSVPKSYIGTVDVVNVTEGKGYMPISWLQYCVGCSATTGWQYQYDKSNFAMIRYDITTLDKAFVTEASKWTGLMYITNGNDSNNRWFHVPPYFGELVATLDR